MRFLLDENLSPRIATILPDAGHDTVHVRQLEFSRERDHVVLSAAIEQDRLLVSADTDFGEILARTNAARPSVLFLRRQQQRRAQQVADLIITNLPPIQDDLNDGAIVVLDDERIRIRRLPMRPV